MPAGASRLATALATDARAVPACTRAAGHDELVGLPDRDRWTGSTRASRPAEAHEIVIAGRCTVDPTGLRDLAVCSANPAVRRAGAVRALSVPVMAVGDGMAGLTPQLTSSLGARDDPPQPGLPSFTDGY